MVILQGFGVTRICKDLGSLLGYILRILTDALQDQVIFQRGFNCLMLQGILNTRPQPPLRAVPFTDSELHSLKIPVLLLIGERSVIYNPQRAYQRALQLIPNVQAEIVPEASHALNAEKAEFVNARVLEFF